MDRAGVRVMAKSKKEYTVVGNHAVAGHEPGTTFSSDMDAEHAQNLIDAGHIKAGKEASDG